MRDPSHVEIAQRCSLWESYQFEEFLLPSGRQAEGARAADRRDTTHQSRPSVQAARGAECMVREVSVGETVAGSRRWSLTNTSAGHEPGTSPCQAPWSLPLAAPGNSLLSVHGKAIIVMCSNIDFDNCLIVICLIAGRD